MAAAWLRTCSATARSVLFALGFNTKLPGGGELINETPRIMRDRIAHVMIHRIRLRSVASSKLEEARPPVVLAFCRIT